jgi:hypothetical protein
MKQIELRVGRGIHSRYAFLGPVAMTALVASAAFVRMAVATGTAPRYKKPLADVVMTVWSACRCCAGTMLFVGRCSRNCRSSDWSLSGRYLNR